ncbi:prepilin-type N-terminal cleavage/methylation domain-containing protein [Phascolarctobacterium faecium]|uniref:prepilin-type N-terminal cleavage/methylation domain-containing protein n=1 Tax=Phascolarctobacterium faecium TaxID=33025 RepID=UPI002674BD53|nr:prepilin-type N-terminal cleavage/methylation domain-containing protein [Phascolarctobacterium faecium]
MKKQSGFTLIELVVAMAVLGLIMGAMVHLFGSSVTSLHVGARQEVVYEEARLLMNVLKTTLRYADKDSIDPEQPTVSTSKFSYKGNLWDRHMDIAQGTNKEYKVTVEWKDDTKKQVQVTREDITDGSKKITVFPNDSNNSIFEGKFPVTSETLNLNDGNTVIMYKIALPLQYEFNGQMKTQTLETKVVPSEEEEKETIEERIYKSYHLLLSIAEKKASGTALTSSEQVEYNKFENYYISKGIANIDYCISNNDKLRTYILETKFNGTWPAKTINGVDVYMQPYCDINSKPATNNVFVFGSTSVMNESSNKNWNVNYIYDYERKIWNTGNTIMVANKSLEKIKSEMNSKGWTNAK